MMGVPAQLMQVPLRVGLDEGTDPSQLPPGTLTHIRNGVWNKLGRLEKRCGSTLLTGSLATLLKLWERNGELLATDGVSLYSRSTSLDAWRTVQPIQALEARWETAVDTTTSVDAADIDATSTLRATAWLSNGSLYVQAEDAVTGARVYGPQLISDTVEFFRVLVFGTSVVTLLQLTGSHTISSFVVDVAAPGPLVLNSVVTNAIHANPTNWDVCHNGTGFTLVYKTNASNVITLASFTSALAAVGSTIPVVTAFNAVALALHATVGEYLYVAYAETSATNMVKVAVHDPTTLVQTTAATTIYTGSQASTHISVIRASATSCLVAFTELLVAGLDAASERETRTFVVSSTAVVDTGTNNVTRWSQLASKLFTVGGRFYMLLSSVRPAIAVAGARFSQNTTFAVEVETTSALTYVGIFPHKMAACIAPREGAVPFYPPCGAVVVGTEAFSTALYVASAVGADSSARNGLRLVTMSTELSDPWSSAQLGRLLVTAGGLNGVFDGRRQFEIGFLHAPRVISATPGSSGDMAAGTYLYSFVYEWRDATGLLHRSAPSQPVSVIVGATGDVVFVLENAVTSGRTDLTTGASTLNALPAVIVPYRTKVGGTTFYRRSIEPVTGMIVNTPEVSKRSWTDTALDADIDGAGTDLGTREILYTTGGTLDEVIPPSATSMTMHRDRLCLVAGDERSVWLSKKYTENPGVFPGFHEDLRVVVDGRIVAIRSLDDKLVIYTDEQIYVLYGDGPTASGQGSDYQVVLIQGDIGCRSARSVVDTPEGHMFLAQRGYYVLTRALELRWIGREVQDELAAFPNVLFASLVSHRSQVRIGVENDAGDDGVVMVFDFSNGNWSVFEYPSHPQSALVIDDVWHFTQDADVAIESDSTSLDSGTWVTLSFEVTLTPSGPIAWQHVRRVQLLGERQSHHDLRMQFAFDHRSSFSQDFTFPAAMVAVNNDCPTERVGSQNGANPKCKAIRIRVTDATPTDPGTYPIGTGKGGWFNAIGLELIPKPGLPRHGARFAKV